MSRRKPNTPAIPEVTPEVTEVPTTEKIAELKLELELKKAQEELKAVKATNSELSRKLDDSNSELEKVNKTNSELSRKLNDANNEIGRLASENSELKTKLERAAALVQEADGLRKECADLRARLDETTKMVTKAVEDKPSATTSGCYGYLSANEQGKAIKAWDVIREEAKSLAELDALGRDRAEIDSAIRSLGMFKRP